MTKKINLRNLENILTGCLIFSILVTLLIGVSFTTTQVIGATNTTNRTVAAKVNVSNTEPNITSMRLDDGVDPTSQIELTAHNATTVTCNATVFDFNGWEDINPNETNATFYIQSMAASGATDNNFRYRNASCGSCRQATAAEASGLYSQATTAICDCKFAVQYYANDSSTWRCNMSVRDNGGYQHPDFRLNLTTFEVSDVATVTKLLAIDTPSLLIDYGNLSVTETSGEIQLNVTNVGNVDINLTLRGFGGDNDSLDYPGNNLTMMCDYGNISIGNQRYKLGTEFIGLTGFNNMTILQNQTQRTNLTLRQRENDTERTFDTNTTLWRLQVPLTVGGLCNGTIIFGAIEQI